MAGILKVDEISEATQNDGVILNNTVKVRLADNSTQTVISTSGNTTTLDNVTLGSSAVPTNNYTFRNKIINGDMRIDQRNAGSATGAITSSAYTIDRWAIRNATSVQQSTDVPSDLGFKNSLFYDNDGTRVGINIRQPIEDVATLFTNKSCTLSFYLKASSACTISVDFCDLNTTNIDVTTSWDRYSVTFPAESSLNPSNIYVAGAGWIDFNLGSSYPDVYITGIQLEEGSVATPFEHRPYGLELSLCQRYYQKYANTLPDDGNVITLGNETVYSATAVQNHFNFIAPMRAAPTFTKSDVGVFKSYSGSTEAVSTAIGAVMLWEYGARINITTTGQVAGNACKSYIQNGKWIAFESELL